jgi:hypothetical protein
MIVLAVLLTGFGTQIPPLALTVALTGAAILTG